ncbi:PP2C family protein-serine/threonine phosphatase [Stieleria varia]|nr:protein phosphatase 2C domain-containing protein [Stieleria varia]
MRRTNNQDSHATIPAKSQERFLQRGHLFIVADGMGAHAAGELASRMATDHIAMNYFRLGQDDSAQALLEAIHTSNAEIYQRGQKNPEFYNMGTTASSLAIVPDGAIVGHVGDSRVYRLRKGVFEQLTFDHSLVWEMHASGQVHPDSALGQAIPKNVITRSLGPNADVNVDIEGPFKVEPGDQFLLCSDGLSGQVDDVEIATLVDCLPEALAVQVLVDLANLRGGPDNTTVVIVRADEGITQSNSAVSKPKPVDRNQNIMVASFAACIVLTLAAIAFWSQTMPGAMVLCLLGTLITLGIGITALSNRQKSYPSRNGAGHHASQSIAPQPFGGKAPYRRYQSAPNNELFAKLGSTVKELKDVATTKNWLMDWGHIDQLQAQGADAMKSGDGRTAIRLQAEAIVETMQQLREQHNRAADETAIDH